MVASRLIVVLALLAITISLAIAQLPAHTAEHHMHQHPPRMPADAEAMFSQYPAPEWSGPTRS